MADKTILEPVKKSIEKAALGSEHGAEHAEGWNAIFGNPLMKGDMGSVHIDHLLMSGVVVLVIVLLGLLVRGKYTGSKEDAVIPEGYASLRNMVEVVFDFTLDTMSQVMNREDAKRYFPLIIALVVFILIHILQ